MQITRRYGLRRIRPTLTAFAGGYFRLCEDLTSQLHAEMIEPGPRYWDIIRRLCLETDTTGPRTTDARLAALAIGSGCEWITMDRHFGRLPGLRWNGPSRPSS